MSVFSKAGGGGGLVAAPAPAGQTPEGMSQIANLAGVAGVLGAGTGAWITASNERMAMRFRASAGDINARIAELAARSTMFAGQRAEQAVRLRGAQTGATQRAAFAASGMDLASDTVMDVLAATRLTTDVDAATVAANTAREAWGHRVQEVGHRGDAAMARVTARNISPLMHAGTTLLTDAARVGRRWRALEGTTGTSDQLVLDALGF